MKNRRLACCILFALLSACAQTKFEVSESTSSILMNWYETVAGKYYAYCFISVNERHLEEGWTARREAKHTIPSGETAVRLEMIYGPEGAGGFKAPFKPIYWIWAEVKFNAKAGHTYKANGEIVENQVHMWVEDLSGERVSDVVTPFRLEKVPMLW